MQTFNVYNPSEQQKALEFFRTEGFCAIADHGLDFGLMDQSEGAAKDFFAQDEDHRQSYMSKAVPGLSGYFRISQSKYAEDVDMFNYGPRETLLHDQRFPRISLPAAEQPLSEFYTQCCGLSQHFVDLIARHLGQEILRLLDDHNNTLRFMQDRKSTRLNSSHSDRSRMPSSA